MPNSLQILPYKNVDNTVENIFRLIDAHFSESYLAKFDSWSLQRIFDYVRRVPYRTDPNRVPISGDYDNIDMLQSPHVTMFGAQFNLPAQLPPGGDCDDKTILLGCIFKRKGIQFRPVVVSTKPDKSLHHIYLEINPLGDLWLPFDATYAKNKIFTEEPYTRKRIYYWDCAEMTAYELTRENYKELYSTPETIYAGALNGEDETLLGGTKLAILQGSDKGFPRPLTFEEAEQLAGETGLGLFPVGTVIAIGSAVAKIFGGLFAPEKYQDAYNVWEAAESQLRADYGSGNFKDAAIQRSIIAVLSSDVMNPPLGPNLCTSSGRCGNRAEWAKVQPDVEGKVTKLAPFMWWLMNESGSGNTTDMALESLVSHYRDMKANGPLYQKYLTATKQVSSQKQAGSASTFTIAALFAAGILMFAKKGKRKLT